MSKYIKLNEVHDNCESTLLRIHFERVTAVHTNEYGETEVCCTDSSVFEVEESVDSVLEQLDNLYEQAR